MKADIVAALAYLAIALGGTVAILQLIKLADLEFASSPAAPLIQAGAQFCVPVPPPHAIPRLTDPAPGKVRQNYHTRDGGIA